jgi:hypothetical protein
VLFPRVEDGERSSLVCVEGEEEEIRGLKWQKTVAICKGIRIPVEKEIRSAPY